MGKTEELLEHLKEAARIADQLPEKYQLKAFEILAAGNEVTLPPENPAGSGKGTKPPIQEEKGPIHLKVRALLTQYELDEGVIDKVFFREGKEITAIYKLKTVKGSGAQIGHALMLCLQEAVDNGNFRTTHEALKAFLNEHKAYSANNYGNNFKNNAGLFKDINGDVLELSTDGKAELASLLGEITSDDGKGT